MKLSEFKPTEEVLERVGKCTASEEVEKLAQEYGVELTAEEISELLKSNSLKELKDEQLDQVAGGEGQENPTKYLPPDHGPWIGKYEAEGHIGQRAYCVRDSDPKQFCWGTIVDSCERNIPGTWLSIRCHDIRVEGWNHDSDELPAFHGMKHWPVGEIFIGIKGDICTLFLYKN